MMAHSFRDHGDISSTPMIPHGGGPPSYRPPPEMTQDTPRITFLVCGLGTGEGIQTRTAILSIAWTTAFGIALLLTIRTARRR